MKNTTTGANNQIQHITKDSLAGGTTATCDPEANEVHIEFMPTGGLSIVLPGPNAVPPSAPAGSGDTPNEGDQYTIRDPLGLVSDANKLTVKGGGFKLAVSPTPPSSVQYGTTSAGGSVCFTFNSELSLWCPCCPCMTPVID